MLQYHKKAQMTGRSDKKKWTLKVKTEFYIGSYWIPEFICYCHSYSSAFYKAFKLSRRKSHILFAAIINLLGNLFSNLENLR